jgi:DNA repair photolyase
VCATLSAAGLPCGVLMAPIVPFLSDSPGQLEATVRAIADARATHVSPIVLHLRPGAREWFLSWLGEHHPDLLPRYRELYGRGSYAPRKYQDAISATVRELAERHRVGHASPRRARRIKNEADAPKIEQLSLL